MKEMVFHRWTKEMEDWLKKNFRSMGDKDLAEMMNVQFPHKYTWRLKHVEKKRSYLNLKRTKQEVFRLRQINNTRIDRSKMWKTRGVSKVGSIKVWKHCNNPVEYIRLADRFERLARVTWESHYGKISKGFNVVRKVKEQSAGDIENLMLLSNAELAIRNKASQYPAEIKEAKIILHRIKKKINEKQNFRSKQSSVRAA